MAPGPGDRPSSSPRRRRPRPGEEPSRGSPDDAAPRMISRREEHPRNPPRETGPPAAPTEQAGRALGKSAADRCARSCGSSAQPFSQAGRSGTGGPVEALGPARARRRIRLRPTDDDSPRPRTTSRAGRAGVSGGRDRRFRTSGSNADPRRNSSSSRPVSPGSRPRAECPLRPASGQEVRRRSAGRGDIALWPRGDLARPARNTLSRLSRDLPGHFSPPHRSGPPTARVAASEAGGASLVAACVAALSDAVSLMRSL